MKRFWQKSLVIFSICLVLSLSCASLTQAQIPVTVTTSVPDTLKTILDRVWQYSQIALLTGWKNGINLFLANWAKNEATRLATGGRGQSTGFVKSASQNFADATDAAIGDTLNSLAQNTLGINLCSLGDPRFAANLFVTFGSGNIPAQPTCTWQKIKQATYQYQQRLNQNQNLSDWAKVNLRVQVAATGIGLSDDPAIQQRCQQITTADDCNNESTATGLTCFWYGPTSQCESRIRARTDYCRNISYYDTGKSTFTIEPATSDSCTVQDRSTLGIFTQENLGNCKWLPALASSVNTSGSCVPDQSPLELFGDQFSTSGGSSDIGTALVTQSILAQRTAQAAFNTNANLQFSGMTLPTQNPVTLGALVPREPSQAQATMLQQGLLNNMLSDSGSAIVNAANVFLGTFLQQWMSQVLVKGLDVAGLSSNFNSSLSPLKQAQAIFAQWQKPQLVSTLQEHLQDQLVTCNPQADEQGQAHISNYNCTIDEGFAAALQAGLTVRQAVQAGYLDPNKAFGFQADGSDFAPADVNPLSFRSLTILRSLEVIPVGWEIAAMYAKNFATQNSPSTTLPVTLNYLAGVTNNGTDATQYSKGCFEDPQHPDDPHYPTTCLNKNGINPWWHLVDPDWVLKLPPTKCALGGNGQETLQVSYECTEDNVPDTTLINSTTTLPINTPACDPKLYDHPDLPVAVVSRNNNYCADRQDCLQTDSHGNCLNYGYCYEQKSAWKFSGSSCSEQAASCTALTRTTDAKPFYYLKNTLQSCNKPGCTWLADSTDSAGNWQLGQNASKVFLTLGANGAQTCDSHSAGCTHLIKQDAGLNVVEDGDFSHANWTDYWSDNSTGNCSVGKSSGAEGQTNPGLDFNGSGCQVQTNSQIPIVPNGIYLVRLFAQSGSQSSQVIVRLFDQGSKPAANLGTLTLNIPANQVGVATSTIVFNSTNPNSDQILLVPEISASSVGSTSTIQSLEIVKVDSVSSQFANNNYNTDYSQATNFDAYYKVAPDNLQCDKYYQIVPNVAQANCNGNGKIWRDDWQSCVAGGSASCANYLPFCPAEDVGCLGYTPVSGGPQVPAKTSSNNYCPNSCIGLAAYQRKTTVFEQQEGGSSVGSIAPTPDSFIPSTAQSCRPQAAGCEEFTNLDKVAAGGEAREYYTFLRQCVQDSNQSAAYYYTWEGSDTAGFQLKRWHLLGSNLGSAPCTNVAPGASACRDGGQYPAATCSQADLATNPNCRDFFDVSNNHYYLLQDRTITASTDCHAYRRTLSGQTYNAIPSEGVKCQASENNCREYLGNQGNSSRTVYTQNFENPASVPAAWLPKNSLSISNIAVQPGSHSMLVNGNNFQFDLTSANLQVGHRYVVTAWAKLNSGSNNESVGASGNNPLEFHLGPVTADWQLLRSEALTVDSSAASYTIKVFLAGGSSYLVDTISLQEVPDSFYVIANSWKTPTECTDNYQGCQAYRVSSGGQAALTGFAKICQAQSLGCQAMIDTRNSTVQGAVSYSQGNGVNNVLVPNDRLLYLVPQADKACTQNDKACQALGLPQINLGSNSSNLTGVSAQTVYLKNDPDKYQQILCSADQLFCSAYGNSNYFDPAPATAVASSAKVCTWQDNKWVKADGSPCPTNPGNDNYLLASNQSGYSGYAGSCSAADNLCTEYRDPEQPNNDKLNLCRSDVGPNTWATCTLNNIDSSSVNSGAGGWCRDGSGNILCKVTSGNSCQYNNLWYCAGSGSVGGDCHTTWYGQDIIACRYTNKDATGQAYCQFDVSCHSYFQKSDSIDTSCGPEVDRGQGCRLFNDTSNSTLNWNATSSRDGSVPANATNGLLAQANTLIKVTPDRQCSEWLYCKSSLTVQQNGKPSQLCLGLGACKKFNANGDCAEAVVHQPNSENINLEDPNGSSNSLPWSKITQYQTGYKYPTVNWSKSDQLVGNYLPDLMAQTSKGDLAKITLTNGGFEDSAGSVNGATISSNSSYAQADDEGWNYETGGNSSASCVFKQTLLGNVDRPPVYDSNYALEMSLNNVKGGSCELYSNPAVGSRVPSSPNSGHGLLVTGRTGYTLTFWARAEQSNLQMRAGFVFYNDSGPDSEKQKTFTNVSTQWQKYTIGVSGAEVARTAKYLFVNIQAPYISNGGAILVDEVSLEPGLQTATDLATGINASGDEAYAAAQCRLYPKSDSPSCSYTQSSKMYDGLKGYCLETDPFNGLCLKWYPLTYISGTKFSALTDEQTIAYDDKAPLYYCLQSNGASNYYDPKGNYTFNYVPIANIDTREQNVSISGYNLANLDKIEIINTLHNGIDPNPNIHLDADIFRVMNCGEEKQMESLGNYHNVERYLMYRKICNGSGQVAEWKAYPLGFEYPCGFEDGDNLGALGVTCVPPDDWNFNQVSAHVYFDQNGNNSSIHLFYQDMTGRVFDSAGYDLKYYQREFCSSIAQVVDDQGNSKIKLNVFNSGWNSNPWGLTKGMAGSAIQSSPYGSVVPLPAPDTGAPNTWSLLASNPLAIYQGNNPSYTQYFGGYPLSLQNQASVSNRQCIRGSNPGQSCNTSADCSGNGICMGVGKLCYNSSNQTNGKTCSDNTQCSQDYAVCQTYASSTPLNVGLPTTINRLQGLFASGQVYNYNPQTQRYAYSSSWGNSTDGTAPSLIFSAVSRHTIPATGGSVNLRFTTDVNPDQAPIKILTIDWGDSQTDFLNWLNPRSDAASPFSLNHTYSCLMAPNGHSCLACSNGAAPVNGQCSYSINVNIQDNWDKVGGGNVGGGPVVVGQ